MLAYPGAKRRGKTGSFIAAKKEDENHAVADCAIAGRFNISAAKANKRPR